MIFSMSVPKTRKYEQHYWLHTTIQDSSKCPKCFAFSLFKLNAHLNYCIKTKQITENIKKKLSNFLTLCSDSYYTLCTQKALVHADDNFSKNTCCFSLACISPDSCNHWECVSQPAGKERTLVITYNNKQPLSCVVLEICKSNSFSRCFLFPDWHHICSMHAALETKIHNIVGFVF